MPGAMRKLGLYLGLVEDDEDSRGLSYVDDQQDQDDEEDDFDPPPVTPTPRRWTDDSPRTAPIRRPSEPPPRQYAAVALDTAPRIVAPPVSEPSYRITTLHPRTYNEARTIGEHYRQGTPVIMNLTEMDDGDAKRLVDFAAGLIFGLRGSIERVTNKVFLLSPQHVKVTAEDKARIAEGGFFNQS